MEAAVATSEGKRIPAALVTAILTVAVWSVHIGIREMTSLAPGAPLRLAVTAALVIMFGVHVIVTARMMRRFDEFTKTVHLQALTIAFPASMIALFAIGFFRAEGVLSEMDPRDLVMLMLLAYAGSLTWAWRRY